MTASTYSNCFSLELETTSATDLPAPWIGGRIDDCAGWALPGVRP